MFRSSLSVVALASIALWSPMPAIAGQTALTSNASIKNDLNYLLYNPADYDTSGRTYPLVVCFDGSAFVSDAYVPLPTVLDNLIADRRIPPVVAVLPGSLDSETRIRELVLHAPFVDFLVDDSVVIEFDGLVKYRGGDGQATLDGEKIRSTS